MGISLSAPQPISIAHDASSFDSGELSLDDWLRRRALRNESIGASRTYVVLEDSARIVGYYTLSTGAITCNEVPGKVRRNMPDPIPVMVLGRLAIDTSWQGKGLGRDLLRDAIFRTLQAATIAGIRALLVHALNDRAAQFYLRSGFIPSPTQPLTYMLLLKDAAASLPD